MDDIIIRTNNPHDFYGCITRLSQKRDTQGILTLKRRQGTGIPECELEHAEELNGLFTDVFVVMLFNVHIQNLHGHGRTVI